MAIFFLARVMRAAMVASLTRNARATSAVVSPQTRRSVRRDLGIGAERRVTAREDQPEAVIDDLGGVRVLRARSLRPLDETREGPAVCRGPPRQSTARRRATVVNHAPGLAGIPLVDQVANARAYASWTHSSARSMSPVTRTVAARTKAHSRRCASATAASTEAFPGAWSGFSRTS